MIICPLISSKIGSTFVSRIVAFRVLNSFLADRTSSDLPNGPPIFHSLDEEDRSSHEVDKLSSDSDSDSSSSGEDLDSSGDSAPILTTSATALGFGDLCHFSLGSFLGVPPRGVPRGVPFGVVFGVAPRLLALRGLSVEMEAS